MLLIQNIHDNNDFKMVLQKIEWQKYNYYNKRNRKSLDKQLTVLQGGTYLMLMIYEYKDTIFNI